jgi:type VII secretion protein EccE
MTTSVTDPLAARGAIVPVEAHQNRPAAGPAPRRLPRRGTLFGVHGGQIVAAEVALALLVGAATQGLLAIAGATLIAAVILTIAWVRLRRRWLYQWLGIGSRYLSRRRTLPAGAAGSALLDLVHPGATLIPAELDHDAAAVISDPFGLTAVIELGDPAALLADTIEALPAPTALLPAAAADIPQVRIQLLVTGVPGPALRAGNGAAATSYRQLTEGRLLSQQRAVLAVRVLRGEGWSEPDLRRSLSSLVRKVRRRLRPVAARPLGETAALAVLAELAHHDGTQPGREVWQATHLGGLLQATFRLRRWPDLRVETAQRLVPRLLTLPASATTVSIAAGSAGSGEAAGVDLVVRLATINAAGLSTATQALRRLLAAESASAQRLDGEQLEGFAATLPLGGASGLVEGADGASAGPAGLSGLGHAGGLAGLHLPFGGDGMMIGTNRHGAPVTIRLFRAEPTRGVLIGGVRATQLFVLRAMALGARIVVQTARPYAWEPFVRGVSTPGESIVMVPPGRPLAAPPGTPLQPLLLIVDVGPVAAETGGSGWQTTMVVRDELAPVDVDVLSRADLVILQPLRPDEAALAGGTLGLGDAQDWLTRIREDMVGVVNRRTVRWALLTATPIERQLVGTPARG